MTWDFTRNTCTNGQAILCLLSHSQIDKTSKRGQSSCLFYLIVNKLHHFYLMRHKNDAD